MKLLILIICLILIFVILLFIRKNKEQTLESFSLGDFLHQNYHKDEHTSIISKINDFFNTDSDNDGGENNQEERLYSRSGSVI